MIRHADHTDREIRSMIRSGRIQWAGHSGLEIYGRLDCWSGKKMNRENRVFFESEAEAIEAGFRPCGHCHSEAYEAWKAEDELVAA